MRAVVQSSYGPSEDVLRVEEVLRPIPEEDEVLIRVKAASIHPDVWHMVSGTPWVARLFSGGLSRPRGRTPGIDVSGIVEAVGKNVTDFSLGDEVFGETHTGLQWQNGGAFAEYVAAPAANLAHKPARVTFEQAATVPTSGMIALFNFPDLNAVKSGCKVLVNGAGGGVGTSALQIAKSRGARVTAVDTGPRLEMLTTLGADHVIDFRKEDFVEGSERYDLIYDVASTLRLSRCKKILTEKGQFVVIGHDHYGAATGRVLGSLPYMFALMFRTPFERHLPPLSAKKFDKAHMIGELARLLEAEQLTPLVDSRFPLDQVPQALSHLASGKALGRLVIVP